MPEIALTVAGNLTADPELRFTQSGAAVASFTVASTPRYFDKNKNEWKDGDAVFVRCTVWRQQAENVAESMRRGERVVVTGTLRQSNWEDGDGNKRSRLEMQCDEVAASMRFAEVKATRRGRSVEDQYDPEPEDPWGSAPEPEPEPDPEPAQEPAKETRERAQNGRQRASQARERASTSRRSR